MWAEKQFVISRVISLENFFYMQPGLPVRRDDFADPTCTFPVLGASWGQLAKIRATAFSIKCCRIGMCARMYCSGCMGGDLHERIMAFPFLFKYLGVLPLLVA